MHPCAYNWSGPTKDNLESQTELQLLISEARDAMQVINIYILLIGELDVDELPTGPYLQLFYSNFLNLFM